MRNMYIVCKNSNIKGTLNFYIYIGNEEVFLFTQKFKHGMYNFFRNGTDLNTALDFKKAHRDKGIINIMRRLLANISYVEKNYGYSIMERTKKKCA